MFKLFFLHLELQQQQQKKIKIRKKTYLFSCQICYISCLCCYFDLCTDETDAQW